MSFDWATYAQIFGSVFVSEGSRKEINLGPQIANQEWDVGSILLRETVGRDSREEQVLRLVSPGN